MVVVSRQPGRGSNRIWSTTRGLAIAPIRPINLPSNIERRRTSLPRRDCHWKHCHIAPTSHTSLRRALSRLSALQQPWHANDESPKALRLFQEARSASPSHISPTSFAGISAGQKMFFAVTGPGWGEKGSTVVLASAAETNIHSLHHRGGQGRLASPVADWHPSGSHI